MKKRLIAVLALMTLLFSIFPTSYVQAATYKKGSKGTAVQYLQQNISFLGYATGSADGDFGNNTKKAVIAMQKALHIKETGEVDEELNDLIQGTVSDIQLYLTKKGYYNGGVDGIKGYGTGRAFKQFQKDKGFAQTAIVSLPALKYILEDTSANISMNHLKEWVERLEDRYIEEVKATDTQTKVSTEFVQGKLDELAALLENRYFTTTQKACLEKRASGHGCDKCSVYYIVKKNWFKNMFGDVDVENFPEHYHAYNKKDNSGQSCFGFACFAQWYIYKTSNNQKVTAERIAIGKFNRSFVEENVKPGDVLRLDDGHSVVVYSVEDNGVMVLDSNWNKGGQLNCLVQKHLVSYSNSYYANESVYVHRVDYRDAVIAVAKNELETSGNKVLDGTNKYNLFWEGSTAWCADFVNWCAGEAGIPYEIFPHMAEEAEGRYEDYTIYKAAYYKGYNLRNVKGLTDCLVNECNARYYTFEDCKKGVYKPQAGDVVIYGNSSTEYCHMGYLLEHTDEQIITIEGNTTYNGVEGCLVKKHRTYKASGHIGSGWYIQGFISPNY